MVVRSHAPSAPATPTASSAAAAPASAGYDGALVDSALRRVTHMSEAVGWFRDRLEKEANVTAAFLALAGACCEAALEPSPADAASAPVTPGTRVRQVHFVAVGKSGGVAQVVVSMLVSVGICARYLHPTEAFHGDFGSVLEGDAVVCLSNGGRSHEILEALPRLKERGCRVFAITGRLDSPLARAASHVLPLPPVEELCPLNQAPITSTVTTLALCQLVVAATMEKRSFALERYARNHPGGAIGKRIFVKVGDLMVQGERLPTVDPGDDFKVCVSRMTEFACAALLVVEAGHLAGLISEKDLRVGMERHGPGVFGLRARDFMNPSPITVEKGMLAVDALALMENRPRPLNILPVTGPRGEVEGLLRIHDLVSQGIGLR